MSYTRNKTGAELDDISQFLKGVASGDDKGISVIGGQFSVGTPESPQEAVFGGGDSYPVQVAYHCDIANESGATITGATDVSAIFQSDNSSSVGLFGGITTGKFVLVGSDYPFGGTKMKLVATADINPDNVLGEYQLTAGAWLQAPLMVSDSETLEQKANHIGTCASCSEQWRFGFNPLVLPVPWDKVTMNINGVDIEKYWARFRITADINEDLDVEQIKQHTNRYEINANGGTEYFGNARYPKPLLIHQRLLDELDGAAPKDEAVNFAVGISGNLKKNKFENTKVDGYAHILAIPQGIDTSIPIVIRVNYLVSNATTGQFEILTETVQIQIGDKLDGTHPIEFSDLKILPVGANEEQILKQGIHLLSINKLVPGEFLVFKFERDAQTTNLNDTYEGDVIIVSVAGTGYFWKP